VLAVLGGSRWLAAYGVVAAMGAVATAAALALTIALFRIIGAKRTRLVAQIVAAVIGAAFVIGLQIAAIFFRRQPVALCRLAIGLDAGARA
jgi:ABC-2 type transport system permease protein